MSWKSTDADLIQELLEQGKTVRFIAAQFSVNEQTLRMFMSRKRISVRNHQQGERGRNQRKSNDSQDIARRLMALQGLEQSNEIRTKYVFQNEQLRRWIGSPSVFARDLLKIDLQDYQEEMMDLFMNKKRVVVVAGRATGKSMSAAIYLLYNSIVNPGQKQLIISPADRQSRLLFGTIHKFIAANDELYKSVNFKESNMERLRFTNGSEIIPLPSTTFIRGFQNVDLIMCDEAGFFADPEQVFGTIEPMLGVRNSQTGQFGTLVLLSSPNGCTGKLWQVYNDPLYSKMRIPSHRNKYVSEDWLIQQKSTMPSNVYLQEIEAEFIDAEDMFFRPELIEKCSQSYDFLSFPEEEKTYILGVDIGRYRDSSALCVLSQDKEGQKRVESLIELQNTPFSGQVAKIKYLHEQFRFQRVVIEQAGLSLPIVEQLKDLGMPVEAFIPTIDRKAQVYNSLLKQMEEGNVTLPAKHTRLQHQMRMFRYQVTSAGKLKLHHRTESDGDDLTDALAFAVAEKYFGPLVTNITNRQEEVSIRGKRTWDEVFRTYKQTASIPILGR